MIFVSYSWENREPNIKVLEFVAYLRSSGYNVECDIMYIQQETALSFPKMMAECLKKAEKVILVLSEEYKRKADLFSGGVGEEYLYIIEDIKENKNKYILVSFEAIKDNTLERIVPDFLRGREIVDLVADEYNDYKKLFLKLDNAKEYIFPDVNSKKPYFEPKALGKLFKHRKNGSEDAEKYKDYKEYERIEQQYYKKGIPVKDAVNIAYKQSKLFKLNKFKIEQKKSMIEFYNHIIELLSQLRDMVENDYLLKEYNKLYKYHDYYEVTQELLMYEDKIDEIIREVMGKNANAEIDRIKKSDMWFEMVSCMCPPQMIKNPQLVYKEISETIGTLKAAIQLLSNS